MFINTDLGQQAKSGLFAARDSEAVLRAIWQPAAPGLGDSVQRSGSVPASQTDPPRSSALSHQIAFKAKLGLEALMGVKTVGQIAREYQVHPVQVTQWK